MKIDIVKYLKGGSFHVFQDDVAMIQGNIVKYDLICMRAWLKSLEIAEKPGTLLIDSEGGLSDPEILIDMLRVPVHVHVLKNAQSFAALIAFCGSYVTAVEDAVIMMHAARWSGLRPGLKPYVQETLDTHNFKVMSIMGSVLPAGDAKEQIGKAMCSDTEIYLDPSRLYKTAVIDNLGEFIPNLKSKDVADWIRRSYYD